MCVGAGAGTGITVLVGVIRSYAKTLISAPGAFTLLPVPVLALDAINTEVCMAEQAVPANAAQVEETEALSSDELLVEEVSIDGMCGVY